jgi:hypothetical protein
MALRVSDEVADMCDSIVEMGGKRSLAMDAATGREDPDSTISF